MIINKLKKIFKRKSGRQVVYVPSDRQHDSESRNMDMEKIDSIMQAANCGEPSRLYQLAEEIYDKNWDIRQALSTRFSAVNGKSWTIEPASKSEFDLQVAADLRRELISAGAGSEEMVSFKDVLRSLVFGIYSGVSVTETVWNPGGSFAGFSPIMGRTLTFRDNFYRPKLNTNMGLMELPADKYIVQIARGVSGDPARGGLVRILAYLHCFSNVQIKYLLRFVERYGMPFTVAKVDDKTWETERNVIKEMIQNFGPDGGGVFTRGTEMELLQAANNTGDVYFKLLQYLGDAVTKIVLGQLASSSVSSGFSGGDAQSQVRQDILEDDCSIVEMTVNTRIFPVWVKFNYGPDVKSPIFKINFKPAGDLAKCAELLTKLYTAGLEADPVEQSAKFGMKLTRAARPAAPVMQPSQGLALAEGLNIEHSIRHGGNIQHPMNQATLPDNALAEFAKNADNWAGDFAKTVAKFADGKSDSLDLSELQFYTEALTESIEKTIYASIANGLAAKADELKRRKK
ncbi:MAG: DUF935 family protein [Lentisphaerae bacterium]|nr:DUF935 family protein [Lentisphaerota bacterium]